MHPHSRKKGAYQRLFYWLLTTALPGFAAPGAAADHICPAQQIDEQVEVKKVIDGDTIKLRDGRKLRLIGIDTPERARDGQPAQPFAKQATRALRQLIQASDNRVSLQLGAEPRDRYQRLLAHVFDKNGKNINAALIQQGLAVAYTTPPNDRFSNCYHYIDRLAASQGKGFWTHPKYTPIDSNAILDASTGFHRIRAHIRKVAFNANGAWLYAGALGMHIQPPDLKTFDLGWLTTYEDKTILVRGWLHKDKYKPASKRYLRLRHPSSIETLGASPAVN